MRVHLGLGSNLGDRLSELAKALATLRELDPALLVSSVYETAPVGGPSGQPPYLNCVVRLETALSPMEVLQLAQGLEHSARRVREERFGPRTLDVDVLLVDAVTSDDPILTLPHPRMFERAFVLAPLEEIDPKLVPANWRERLGGATVIEGSVRSLGQLLGSSRARKTGTA